MDLQEWFRNYPDSRMAMGYEGKRRVYTVLIDRPVLYDRPANEMLPPRPRTKGEGTTLETAVRNAQEGYIKALHIANTFGRSPA